MKLYLAAPFFNERELACVQQAEEILFSRGFEVFSPRLHEVCTPADDQAAWSRETYFNDRRNLDRADIVVMLYYGGYSDSGTAWEAGYACGKGKPVVAVHVGAAADGSNLMIHESAATNITLEELRSYDFTSLPHKPYKGKMF